VSTKSALDTRRSRRFFLRGSFAVGTALAATGLLSACTAPANPPSTSAGAPAASTTSAPSAQQAPATSAPAAAASTSGFSGTINEAQNGEAKFNNPLFIVDVDGTWHTDLIFDAMVGLDAATLKPVPRLAKSWDVSPDGLMYTFHLNTGVKWHDGQPYSAEDTRFTILTILTPGYSGPFQKDWSGLVGAADVIAGTATDLEGVKVLDPNTIQFKLNQVDATFMTAIMPNLKSVPKHLLEGQPIATDSAYSQAPVGTGPYKFVQWSKGATFTLQANDDYWQTPPVAVKRIVQRVFPDQQSLVLSLEAGDSDYSINVPPDQLGEINAQPQLQVVSAPPQYYDAFQFNLRNQFLANASVRQAIAAAFDRDKFSQDNTSGFLKAANGIIGWGSWAYDASAKGVPFSMDTAKQLLAGVGSPPSTPLRIVTNTGNTLRANAATVLQAQLKTLGINAKVDMLEFGALLTAMTSGDFDIGVLPFNSAYPDPDRMALYFATSAPSNYYAYSNPKVDGLFADARKTTDFDQRKNMYLQIQQQIMTDLPVIPLYDYQNLIAINKKFKGIQPSALGQRWNIKDWTV
jgi:peptide/nickel transport system substrate-binding protein